MKKLADLRRVLRRRRGSMAAIARECGVSRPHVTLVLQGRVESARVLEAAERHALLMGVAPKSG